MRSTHLLHAPHDTQFRGATVFNADISQWNVAAVTNMEAMVRNRRRDDLA